MSGEIEPQLSPPPSFSHPVTAAAERAKIESRGRRRRKKGGMGYMGGRVKNTRGEKEGNFFRLSVPSSFNYQKFSFAMTQGRSVLLSFLLRPGGGRNGIFFPFALSSFGRGGGYFLRGEKPPYVSWGKSNLRLLSPPPSPLKKYTSPHEDRKVLVPPCLYSFRVFHCKVKRC